MVVRRRPSCPSSDMRRSQRTVQIACTALAALLLPWGAAGLQDAAPDDDPTPHSTGALVSADEVVVPGRTLDVGLHLTFDPGWHTYWINPGDSGSEALLEWTLPPGFTAGPIRWPFPQRLAYPPLMSFAYPDEVLLPVRIEIPDEVMPGERVTLGVDAEWLVCEEICLVAGDSYSLTLPVAADPRPDPGWSDAFAAAERALPFAAPGWGVEARVDTVSSTLGVGMTPPDDWDGSLAGAWFFPVSPTLVEHTEAQPRYGADGAIWQTVSLSPYASALPDTLEGIVVLAEGEELAGGGRRSLAVDVPLQVGALPSPPPVAAEADAEGAVGTSLAAALVLALVGGLLLNLMPCVFPVLSLKILGFVEHAGGDRTLLRRNGIAFAAGVVMSFLALAGLLLALRAAGQGVGWGFQLQDPRVVTALAFLMVAVALNFLGILEVGTALTRLGAVGDGGGGLRGSFLTGVLATLVATPCTAPFMGTAVAAAVVRPPAEGLTIFAGLGLGMALPYTILSFRPGLLSRLPKPGRWMESLRQALAFPMLAVAVWLLWVLGLQVGIDAVARVLVALLIFAAGAWLLHRWSGAALTGSARRGIAARLARATGIAALLAASVAGVAAAARGGVAPMAASDAVAGRATDDAGAPLVTWEAFTPQVVSARRAEGRPVLVDFTAAWCISCQVNKRVALTAPRVERAFADADVALVRADWTRRDDVIAGALEELGRNGVPVYALYPADPNKPPRLLPNVLTPGIVLDALDALDTPLPSTSPPTTETEEE